MAYATVANVEGEYKGVTFSSSTTPTDTNVTRFLAEADAEINSRLGVKYTVPITGTEALIMMRMIEIMLVKHRINDIIAVKTGQEPPKQEGVMTLRQEAISMLNKIAAGTIVLSDATLADSDDGVKSYNVDEDVEPTFDRDTRQW